MIQHDLAARRLPPLFQAGDAPEDWPARRAHWVETLAREVYGMTPSAPAEVRARILEDDPGAWAGKAGQRRVELTFDTPGGPFSFPIDLTVPRAGRPVPLVVYISFTPQGMGRYLPVEEIVDNGYALACLYYNDVAFDGEDGFAGGLAPLYPREGGAAWGKIGMWAFAASRVLDYALTLPEIDPDRILCAGHSRLGKTALWAAAQDTRFAGAFSNDSGCSGAAISRGKQGESIQAIVDQFPYWFCENYRAYAGREDAQAFDQHWLLASIAPRPLYVTSASEDIWADPVSEFLSCVAASEAYRFLGRRGLVYREDAYPAVGEALHRGEIGYHLREGGHFLSRYDWQRFLAFMAMRL